MSYDPFIYWEGWFVWVLAPIVSHHIETPEGLYPSGWRSYIVLPHVDTKDK